MLMTIMNQNIKLNIIFIFPFFTHNILHYDLLKFLNEIGYTPKIVEL